MIDAQPLGGRLSVLRLETQTRTRPDWPVVRILVDTVDPFDVVAPGWQGFDPDDILGPSSPLLPTAKPRRVAVYRCSCGEPGCGVVAPIIERTADARLVLWHDFRDYVGLFSGPNVTYPDVEFVASRSWDVPRLVFDAEQYRAEVRRATQDRGWETPRRQTARLLSDILERHRPILPPDLPLRRVEPAWEGPGLVARFGREAADGALTEQVIRLTSTRQSPAWAALEMAERLLATPPEEWLEVFPDRQ